MNNLDLPFSEHTPETYTVAMEIAENAIIHHVFEADILDIAVLETLIRDLTDASVRSGVISAGK